MFFKKAFEKKLYWWFYDILVSPSYPYQELLKVIFSKLNPLPEEVILDAGCGTGTFLEMLTKAKIKKIYGLDLSCDALNFAKKKAPGAVLLKVDLKKPLPFEKGKFDKIVCINVLYLLPQKERKKILKNFFKLLKNNGKIIIVNPISKGSNLKIFFADIKKSFQNKGICQGVRRLFWSLIAICGMTLPYLKRVKRKLFLNQNEQENLLKEAGFFVLFSQKVYADQAILTVAKKSPKNKN